MRSGGRPSKCTDEVINQALEYVNGGWENEEHQAFPSVIGLSKVLNVGRNTLYEWAEDDRGGFTNILEQINTNQQLVAWDKGLKGEYNANLIKLLLGKHGYSDKQEVEQSTAFAVVSDTELTSEEWKDQFGT
jgi:hypothetical protein